MSTSDKAVAKINNKYEGMKLRYMSYVPEDIYKKDKIIIEQNRADKSISWYLLFTGWFTFLKRYKDEDLL